MEKVNEDFITQIIKWFTGGNGTIWEVAIKIAALLGGGLALFLFKQWAANAAVKEVQKQTEAQRAKDEADVVKENRDTERDATKAEQEVQKKG